MNPTGTADRHDTADTSPLRPGLEGVLAAETMLSHVDGDQGVLLLRGYPAEALAPDVTFEEETHLFLRGKLPNRSELDAFTRELAARRALHPATTGLLERAAFARLEPMDALRMAVASADLVLPRPASEQETALALIAQFPVIVAAYARLLGGKPPLPPRAELGHAAHFLYLLDGAPPSAERVRALETYLNTVADHGMNASTFTARVIMSTQSDLVSAITGAIGALKGPLHGGAPGPALDMVFEIARAERAEPYLREKIGRGDRLLGFGHRVYKVRDPRADVLKAAAQRLASSGEQQALFTLAGVVEQTALRLLEEAKPGRRLQTNVEFYTALVLHAVGLESSIFTPTFAIGRVVGWLAHCFEQKREGRLIRPASRFVGEWHERVPPIGDR